MNKKPHSQTLIQQFKNLYPILLEAQLVRARESGLDQPQSRALIRTALSAEIGELINELKPLWKSSCSKAFDKDAMLSELADVLIFAVASDIQAFYTSYVEDEIYAGQTPVPYHQFTMSHAKPYVDIALRHYAWGWTNSKLLDELGSVKSATEHYSLLKELIKSGWLLFFITPDQALLSPYFYAKLIVLAGSLETLISAYFNKLGSAEQTITGAKER